MKILKHGSMFSFRCSFCECEFTASKKECEIKEIGEPGAMKVVAKTRCPECDAFCGCIKPIEETEKGGFSYL